MVIEACRAVLTERCRLMCKQRGRQQAVDFARDVVPTASLFRGVQRARTARTTLSEEVSALWA